MDFMKTAKFPNILGNIILFNIQEIVFSHKVMYDGKQN